jgi:hypothetical protein
MLVIRKQQLDAIATADVARFEIKMVKHLQKVFPEWSEALGPEKLADFVRHGINRAHSYGFRVELDLARYLHVIQALGRDFDESPDYPWARGLLTADRPASEKMDHLRDAVEYHNEARRIRLAY